MDLSSLDLEHLCANTWVPLLGDRGARLLQAGLPGMSRSTSEGPWGPGCRKNNGTGEEPLQVSAGTPGPATHTAPPQDPAQGSFKPSTKLFKDHGRMPSAPWSVPVSRLLRWPVLRVNNLAC